MAFFRSSIGRISIHALREEGDAANPFKPLRGRVFLSTPSARRATALCELDAALNKISIHALREEGDPDCDRLSAERHYFYPRPPRGGRLSLCRCNRQSIHISIHALREEGDYRQEKAIASLIDFYPRPPRGGRPTQMPENLMELQFLSTPSARRATIEVRCPRPEFSISIHALREEGDIFSF